ncbi:MAG: flagellar basal body rod protein FlgC [Firmicutes bacterium]|nr:flagellar basal body rod protein FlgC [Bacillota bacterium]
MGLFRAFEISASGLTAERLRQDIISNNLANANSTRATQGPDGKWQPYRRQVAVFAERGPSFDQLLAAAGQNGGFGSIANGLDQSAGDGVRVAGVWQDPTPFRSRYDPGNPDADANGYVQMPNVSPVTEMVDLITATRAYEANVNAINATRSMALKALEIGR